MTRRERKTIFSLFKYKENGEMIIRDWQRVPLTALNIYQHCSCLLRNPAFVVV